MGTQTIIASAVGSWFGEQQQAIMIIVSRDKSALVQE